MAVRVPCSTCGTPCFADDEGKAFCGPGCERVAREACRARAEIAADIANREEQGEPEMTECNACFKPMLDMGAANQWCSDQCYRAWCEREGRTPIKRIPVQD